MVGFQIPTVYTPGLEGLAFMNDSLPDLEDKFFELQTLAQLTSSR